MSEIFEFLILPLGSFLEFPLLIITGDYLTQRRYTNTIVIFKSLYCFDDAKLVRSMIFYPTRIAFVGIFAVFERVMTKRKRLTI